ncbi:MAG: elongation factor 1-beta [Nanoarchaeota archaeon]|nr:elongation factor 1-beta [Nanoarchaeota archaeon]
MSTAAVQFKIMPKDLDVNLENLKESLKKVIESFESGVFNNSVEDPIAFGLKALIITFAIAESEETDIIEAKLGDVEGVSSVELIDYRRAIG